MSFKKFLKKMFFKIFSFYPPFFGAGIKVKISNDVKTVDVSMRLTFWNRNYVGTHFGGSLYAMCDPFYFFLLMENLGREYIVWDKGATIYFKKPGKGRVHARFFIPEERYNEIRESAENGDAVNPEFKIDVLDDEDNVIATVEKILYIKKKQPKE
jgi:hypothetical protein